jgi:hypothetical protein
MIHITSVNRKNAEDLRVGDMVVVPHLDCPITTVKEVISNESENGIDRQIALTDRTMKLHRYDDVLIFVEMKI